MDDLFFIGTSVNLARGGEFTNPWIIPFVRQFGTEYFWVQPPFYPRLLGLWLQVTGISAAAVLAFHALLSAFVSINVWLWSRRIGASAWLGACAVLLSTHFCLSFGLRSDVCGAALAAAAITCWSLGRPIAWFAGCLFGAAAPAAHPFVVCLVVPAGLVFLLQPGTRAHLLLHVALALVALLIVIGLFLWSLDGPPAAFWDAFSRHARFRTPQPGTRWAALRHELSLGWEPWLKGPAYLTGAAALLWAWFHGARFRTAQVAVGWLLCLFIGVALYAGYLPRYAPLVALLGALMLIGGLRLTPRTRTFVVLGYATAVGATMMPEFLKLSQQSESAAYYQSHRSQLEQLERKRVLVDEVAGRYLYDFRLPLHVGDWLYSRNANAEGYSLLRDKPSAEAWLVEPHKLEHWVPDSGVRARRRVIAGYEFSNFLIRPGELHLFP